MLTWNEKFATGSVLVDTQHRMLIDKINELEKLLDGPPPPKAACDLLLNFLGTYVGTHFKFEEGCMERLRCPAHAQNQKAHAAFLDWFAEIQGRYLVEGPKPQLLRSLQVFASEWIQNHILTVDINLRTCAKG
jgi:hemerythrin-like metal-binding protein